MLKLTLEIKYVCDGCGFSITFSRSFDDTDEYLIDNLQDALEDDYGWYMPMGDDFQQKHYCPDCAKKKGIDSNA